jgi:hypothetical protein
MMKNITKKQSKEFNDKVTKVILADGFEQGDYYFTKNTYFGLVTVNIPNQTGSEIYTIFSRFDKPNKAIRVFNCNRFTGKYNFHSMDAQETLGMFEYFLWELVNREDVDRAILAKESV